MMPEKANGWYHLVSMFMIISIIVDGQCNSANHIENLFCNALKKCSETTQQIAVLSKAFSGCSWGCHKKGNKVHKWCCAALWSRWTQRRGRNPVDGGRLGDPGGRDGPTKASALPSVPEIGHPRQQTLFSSRIFWIVKVFRCGLQPLRIIIINPHVLTQDLKTFSRSNLHCWKRVKPFAIVLTLKHQSTCQPCIVSLEIGCPNTPIRKVAINHALRYITEHFFPSFHLIKQ